MERTKKPCCEKAVDALIANERSNFTADDKEWLLTQEATMIEKLTPQKVTEPTVLEKVEEVSTAPTKEQIISTLSALKPEEFMAAMPAALREQTKQGLAIHAQHKTKLVKAILANTTEGVWEEDDLKKMTLETLSKIAKSTGKEETVEEIIDYTAMGGEPPVVANSQTVEHMLPTGVELEEKKEK